MLEPKTRRWMHGVASLWGRIILKVTPFWKLGVSGAEHLDRRQTYIVVANHQSLLDILVLFAGLGLHFKFIAKKELFAIPFLGWHMAVAGYVPVDRGNKESAKQAVHEAGELLERGVSILFFPEGTRSPDGEIHEFKTGAFRLASEKGAAVLPVVIDGTGEAAPKHSWFLRRKTLFHLSIGRPVSIPDAAAVGRVAESIRREMIERLARIRRGERA